MDEKDPGPDGEESRAESDPDDPQIGSQKPSLRREPSFSGWCGEHRIACSLEASSNVGAAAEECENFELPLLHGFGGGSENGNMEPELQRLGDFHQRSKVHVPFDIENGGIHTSESAAKLEALEESARSLVKASTVIKTLFFIFIWYTFSTCLTLYNKTLLGVKYGNFPAPLLMNTVHFTLQAIISRIIVCIQSRWSETGPVMSWRDYFMIVVPTALGTALDINLSNASLVSISVTFATMCKSAAPIFLLMFAFAFRLESPSFKLLGIILIISSGVLLTVSKETEFEFWGFVFVMLAAVMSGFRWCMTQILLQVYPLAAFAGLKNPITLMSNVTPVMAAATAILSLFLDPWHNFKLSEYFDNSWHMGRSSLLMLLGGALAFFMVLAEYILISATSAVTVTIAGVVKEAVTIMVAVFYFHDQFTWLKGVGLLLILFGVSLFNWYKYQKLKKGQLSKTEEKSPAMSHASAKYVILDELDPEYGQ